MAKTKLEDQANWVQVGFHHSLATEGSLLKLSEPQLPPLSGGNDYYFLAGSFTCTVLGYK